MSNITEFIKLTNENSGFIAFLSLFLAILMLLLGWLSGFFSWVKQKISKKPYVLVKFRAASYPRSIILSFENLTKETLLIKDLKLRLNNGENFNCRDTLPIVVHSKSVEQAVFNSNLFGRRNDHKVLTLKITASLIHQKEYSCVINATIPEHNFNIKESWIIPK